MLHHYRCATIIAMSPADEASHSLQCPGGYICICVCKYIHIYIIDTKSLGFFKWGNFDFKGAVQCPALDTISYATPHQQGT